MIQIRASEDRGALVTIRQRMALPGEPGCRSEGAPWIYIAAAQRAHFARSARGSKPMGAHFSAQPRSPIQRVSSSAAGALCLQRVDRKAKAEPAALRNHPHRAGKPVRVGRAGEGRETEPAPIHNGITCQIEKELNRTGKTKEMRKTIQKKTQINHTRACPALRPAWLGGRARGLGQSPRDSTWRNNGR
jgi:hypothetical protein